MINMTMRTPRDIPTAAPANLATSLTSVDGEKQVMSDGETVTVTYYTYTMTLVPPETPQHFLHLFTAHKSIELFLVSAELPYVSLSPHLTPAVPGLPGKELV